jgi:hypothetical protein
MRQNWSFINVQGEKIRKRVNRKLSSLKVHLHGQDELIANSGGYGAHIFKPFKLLQGCRGDFYSYGRKVCSKLHAAQNKMRVNKNILLI